jgi:hypothetical protein
MIKSTLLGLLFSGMASAPVSTPTTITAQPPVVASSTPTPVTTQTWFRPSFTMSWTYQLQGQLNTGYGALVYIVDLYDTPQQTINDLHSAGKKVVCYFSAGTYEPWRPDANQFSAKDKGKKLSDWDEYWLDTRSSNVRKIMGARLDLARSKKCDAVDPDNVDSTYNDNGLNTTPDDQLNYNKFLAANSHSRGLGIGLKNDLLQIPQLADDYDFALNEQCHYFNECQLLKPFIDKGKPVWNVEYDLSYIQNTRIRTGICNQSLQMRISTVFFPRYLDGSFRITC